ncbi:uncharacterized protein LOC123554727 isoform X2 [Mercenaria mercenaria]|uniref:uncharacterized protein LOC123554727 isoform X2 n=1 Tax=Mercenaria mercenaria TaxID=6596 RepID=UPI00234F87E7|nr:uncharacterized protein LOC123554727 isoform X2 [Mercenaria mercenaria]
MDKKLKYAVIIVLVSLVVCLTAVLALVWTMPDLQDNAQMCLPSEDGVLKCDTTGDLLHVYLERTISTKYEEIKTKDIKRRQEYLDNNRDRLLNIYGKVFWEMKPAAKLTGKEQPDARKRADEGAEMIPIREWKLVKELSNASGFERYGIRYRNGRLVVPVDGTYFVYSFVNLFEQCDPSTGKPDVKDTSKPIKHGIYKFNILEEVDTEIISSVQPHQISSNKRFNSYDSYVSSFASLKAGDEISVKLQFQ